VLFFVSGITLNCLALFQQTISDRELSPNVRYWGVKRTSRKAPRMSAFGTKRTSRISRKMIEIGHLFAGRVAGVKKHSHEVLLAN